MTIFDRRMSVVLALLLGAVIALWFPEPQQAEQPDFSDTGVGCVEECLEPATDERPSIPLLHPHPVPVTGSRWI